MIESPEIEPAGIAPADGRGVIRLTNDTLNSNTYLVPLAEAGTCVVIDPGLDVALVERALEVTGLTPRAILSTHGHFDHIGSAEPLRRRHGVPFCLHGADAKLAKQANFLMTLCRIDARIDIPTLDVAVDEGNLSPLPGLPLTFQPVPGHTPGSCLIRIGSVAFSGDTLYRRGLDTLPLPGTDNARMRASILALWDELPEDTWIYPGHGGSTPFGDIKRHNAKLRAFLGLEPA